ncbi:PREDICTED: epididymal-specific lipocalin-9 [Chrysochloris asiatica]|uniref:Epididymal-specific lipocalin-9 n=1 Tax=Chrysochloris asiatica TaxID=185453 RepID=A0A9B0TLL6_CHRAS|nr:PREDICTED: epididymal-specific lipocalin-9 [Chrysochloris asiatica]
MALLPFLLSLGLSLATAQQFDPYAVVRSHYDMDKVLGAWYPMAMASSNLSRIQHKGDMHAILKTIERLENGSLTFSFDFLLQGQCETAVMVCKQTQRSGMCTIEYDGKSTVLILETDYKIYIILYLHNIKDTTETRVLALYGTVLTPRVYSPHPHTPAINNTPP